MVAQHVIYQRVTNMMIYRKLADSAIMALGEVPIVAILGPRQCGKTTLAQALVKTRTDSVFLDLESPEDLRVLDDAPAFFRMNREKVICLDEIQRRPELFPVLRTEVDARGKNGGFIVLGSASPNLLRQTSETLAGRIRYLELTPFLAEEVASAEAELRKLWWRGGFPRSFLAESDDSSFAWRRDFIRTFLEKDIPVFGFRVSTSMIERFWTMLAHVSAQILNRSKLGDSLGASHHAIQHYLDILSDCFLVRVLRPFEANLKKRLVKSPKIFFRDSGLLHALLGIRSPLQLVSHPEYGASWECFALENILGSPGIADRWKSSFYRSHTGEEIDLVLDDGSRRVAVEFKSSSAPLPPGKGTLTALKDLAIEDAWVVAPVLRTYTTANEVTVAGIGEFLQHLRDLP
jgi:uncharacterized protein